jgi:Uma2 family endonuclease
VAEKVKNMQVLDTIQTQPIVFSPLLKKYTLEEFWELPAPEDRSHYELIEGVLYKMPPPNEPHGKIVANLNRALMKFIIANDTEGTVYHPRESIYVEFEFGTYLEPDMMFVSHDLETQMSGKRTSSDIVFEVLSDSTAVYDRTTKADTYLALGIKELWLIDLENKTVEIRNETREKMLSWHRRLYSDGETAESEFLTDWKVSLNELFG